MEHEEMKSIANNLSNAFIKSEAEFEAEFEKIKNKKVFKFEINENQEGAYLSIYYDGTAKNIGIFDDCLKKLAPYIKQEEYFYAQLSDEYSDKEILYCFNGESVHKYYSKMLFPENGFYPMPPKEIVKAIKRKPKLAEFIKQELEKDK